MVGATVVIVVASTVTGAAISNSISHVYCFGVIFGSQDAD